MPTNSHPMFDSLVRLGLSEGDATVFVALLEIGPCYVAPIVQLTKKHRQIVYNALESLEKRHLVTSTTKRGKRFCAIGGSERFLDDAREQMALATKIVSKINSRVKHGQEQVNVFSGPDAYEEALADFRRKGEEAQEYVVIGGQADRWYEYTKRFSSACGASPSP